MFFFTLSFISLLLSLFWKRPSFLKVKKENTLGNSLQLNFNKGKLISDKYNRTFLWSTSYTTGKKISINDTWHVFTLFRRLQLSCPWAKRFTWIALSIFSLVVSGLQLVFSKILFFIIPIVIWVIFQSKKYYNQQEALFKKQAQNIFVLYPEEIRFYMILEKSEGETIGGLPHSILMNLISLKNIPLEEVIKNPLLFNKEELPLWEKAGADKNLIEKLKPFFEKRGDFRFFFIPCEKQITKPHTSTQNNERKISIPPSKINEAMVLYYQSFSSQTKPTGKTRHYFGAKLINDLFSQLAICQYNEEGNLEEDKPVYLFYCDENWKVLNDTYHPNVKAAIEQAEFEFEGSNQLWNHWYEPQG